MALLAPRLLVAFDAASVSGALLPAEVGARRAPVLNRVALSEGALIPSPLEDNLVRPAEIREALRELKRRLGGVKTSLILPDGVARTALIEIPRGADPGQYAAFRLGPSLPFPGSEAVVDVLRVGRRRCVAAAIRRRVIQGYETAAAEVGFVQDRVDLAPLAVLAALLRRPPREASVDLILGDAAVSFAAFDSKGTLRALRTRRRCPDANEFDWLREEADRTAILADLGPNPRLCAVGAGAPALIRALSFGGRAARSGFEGRGGELTVDAVEMAWFGAALA